MKTIISDVYRSIRPLTTIKTLPSIDMLWFGVLLPYLLAFGYAFQYVMIHSGGALSFQTWTQPLFLICSVLTIGLSVPAMKVGVWILYSSNEQRHEVIGEIAEHKVMLGVLAFTVLTTVVVTALFVACCVGGLLFGSISTGLGYWT